MFTLPPHLDGPGLQNPIKHASEEFSASMKVTHLLKNRITENVPEISFESWEEQRNAKNEISITRRLTEVETAKPLKSFLPTALQYSSYDTSTGKGSFKLE